MRHLPGFSLPSAFLTALVFPALVSTRTYAFIATPPWAPSSVGLITSSSPRACQGNGPDPAAKAPFTAGVHPLPVQVRAKRLRERPAVLHEAVGADVHPGA